MKRLRLLKLALTNFKGIKKFELDVAGANVRVYGDNATGKTTLYDAFLWLLFDKDSQNKKDFQIKTLDAAGNVLHGLDHEVEGEFDVDGKRLVLQKVFKEKWQKKRGSVEQEFTGHTTDYFIDGVPAKKSEYDALISSIVSEEAFKLLTSPHFFNEQLKWNDRRKILLEVCGDVTNDDIFASSTKLAKLKDILGDRTIEDHRKVIAVKRKQINDELEKLPIRIDEVHRGMPDLTGLNEAALAEQIESLKAKIADKEAEVVRIQSGGEISVKENLAREIEGELIQIRNNFQSDTLTKVNEKRQEVNRIEREIEDLELDVKRLDRRIQSNSEDIRSKEAKADDLRAEYREIDATQYAHNHDESCPTCGQSLPEEQVQVAKDKALSDFNRKKSEQLESINTQGKAIVAEVARLREENEKSAAEIEGLRKRLEAKKSLFVSELEALAKLQADVKDVTTDPQYQQKQAELQAVKDEIRQLRESVQDSVEKVRGQIRTHRSELELLELDKAKFAQAEAGRKRITELEDEEKRLAKEYEELERQLFLTEEFIRQKVVLLEEKINSKFKYARFQLFREQINGGLEEICETLYDGVPYSGGLNNAARIWVGMDIINTLIEHYGLSAPIFIDNAEATTRLPEINAQVIALYVSENDKSLRTEIKTEVGSI